VGFTGSVDTVDPSISIVVGVVPWNERVVLCGMAVDSEEILKSAGVAVSAIFNQQSTYKSNFHSLISKYVYKPTTDSTAKLFKPKYLVLTKNIQNNSVELLTLVAFSMLDNQISNTLRFATELHFIIGKMKLKLLPGVTERIHAIVVNLTFRIYCFTYI